MTDGKVYKDWNEKKNMRYEHCKINYQGKGWGNLYFKISSKEIYILSDIPPEFEVQKVEVEGKKEKLIEEGIEKCLKIEKDIEKSLKIKKRLEEL